ncbi:MAG TPA: DNA translocase FtsK 4TM domain-containing protein, partial [Candidatus Paceibacterota bacterium]|nr:DNA translocase FtsK 4TM domain-containing protein [Candidatus Paceibacterota bacterium]
MSRRNGRSDSRDRRSRARNENVKEYDALIRWASAIVLLAAGVLLLLAIFGGAGPVGAAVFTTSYAIVGIGAFLLPLALIAVGLYAGFGRPALEPLTASGLLLICASVLAFAGLFPSTHFGGGVGTCGGEILAGFFGFWGALVLLLATIAVGIAIVSDLEALGVLLGENVLALWDRIRSRREDTDGDEFDEEGVVGVPEDDAGDVYEDEEAGDENPEREPVVTVFNHSPGARTDAGIANFDAEYDPPPLS